VKKAKPMDQATLSGVISNLVKEAELYRDERAEDRIKAREYFDGEMRDLPSEVGRSSQVSRDVRAAVKKVKPSLARTLLGKDMLAEFIPVGRGDEEQADQATDYINYVVVPEAKVRQAIEDAIDDALLLKNGILKYYYETKREVTVSSHTGVDEMGLAQLVQDDEVEIIETTEYEDQVEVEGRALPIKLYDLKLRRVKQYGCCKVVAVKPEEFLIHPDAIEFDDSPIIGQKTRLRRSDLVSMGYDKAAIFDLPTAGGEDIATEAEEMSRRDVALKNPNATDPSMQEIDYYELYVRVDADNDGVAELRRIICAGGLTASHILENEEWDEIPFADFTIERRPHQWEGSSIYDDLADIQRVKTVLLRQTLDNLYWQNNPQPTVNQSALIEWDGLMKPEFGKPILVKGNVRDAVSYNLVPFVAQQSYSMLSYMDEEIVDRTGISEASSGLAPDALQNVTAKATAMIEQAGIGRTELMVRTLSEGMEKLFKGLLKLTIKHQDKPRTVRLRGNWVTYDPRHWNAGMDVSVNTGLGAGTRERDMMMMQQVIGLQEKLLSSLGPVNPFVKPDNLYNAISKLVEAAGLRSTDQYFTKPDPEEIQKLLQSQQNQPKPEELKTKAQMAIEQAKLQSSMQIEQARMQANRDKEMAQMEADLNVKMAEMEKQAQAQAKELELRREQIASDERIAREKMAHETALFERKMAADIQKAQAQSIKPLLQSSPELQESNMFEVAQ